MPAIGPVGSVVQLSKAEAVADLIERRIGSEGLRSGHRLGTKEGLRKRYDVAVATFNEAVRLLAARGVVSVRPGVKGGVFVAAPRPLVRLGRKFLELREDSVPVADCLAVRQALDPLVVIEAAKYRTARDVRDLRVIVDAMFDETLTGLEYLKLNWSLHRRMAEIGSNDVLRQTYISLLDFVENRLQGVTMEGPVGPKADGPRVHRALVDAIECSDMDRAALASNRHSALTMSRDVLEGLHV